jgi:hypothetical protein
VAKTFVARIQVLGVGPLGEETCSTFHYSLSTTDAHIGDMGQILDQFNGICSSAYRDCIVPAWAWYSTRGEIFQYGTDPFARFSDENFDVTGAVGTSGGTNDAIERAVIVQKKTGLAGHHFRGRVFMPMPRSEVADLNGVLDPAFMPAYDAFGGVMMTPLVTDAGVWTPGVGHHSGDVTCTDLTGYGINGMIGIQKRRRARFLD